MDVIVDHLHDDGCSLRACSQVCRSMLLSSYYHIFGELHFVLTPKYASDDLNAFLTILDGPYAQVATFVRKLHVLPAESFETLAIDYELLRIVLSRLKRLRVLNMTSCYFQLLTRQPRLVEGRTLDKLVIQGLAPANSKYTLSSALHILNLYSKITDLRLSEDFMHHPAKHIHDLVVPAPYKLRVSSLTIDSHQQWFRPIALTLGRRLDPTSVTSVSLVSPGCCLIETLSNIEELVVSLPNIEHFALDFGRFVYGKGKAFSIWLVSDIISVPESKILRLERIPELSSQVKLRTIHLSTLLAVVNPSTYAADPPDMDLNNFSVWCALIDILLDVSNLITNVHITIKADCPTEQGDSEGWSLPLDLTTEHLAVLDWPLLNTLAERCPSLRDIQLEVINGNGKSMKQEVEKMIKGMLRQETKSLMTYV